MTKKYQMNEDVNWEVEECLLERHSESALFGLSIWDSTVNVHHKLFSISNVFDIHPDSSADQQNGRIRPGDVILKVNGMNCFGVSHNSVADVIRQSEHFVQLTVARRQSNLSIDCLSRLCTRAMESHNADMEKLFEAGRFSDFTIRTVEGDRVIKAHCAILEARSQYFEALFAMGGVETKSGEMKVPESYETMVQIIRFLYTGKWWLSALNSVIDKEDANVDVGGGNNNEWLLAELYCAADKYQMDTLKELIEKSILTKFIPKYKLRPQVLTVENACDVLVEAHNCDNWAIKANTIDFIRAHRGEVFATCGWHTLYKNHPELSAHVFFPSVCKPSKQPQPLDC